MVGLCLEHLNMVRDGMLYAHATGLLGCFSLTAKFLLWFLTWSYEVSAI